MVSICFHIKVEKNGTYNVLITFITLIHCGQPRPSLRPPFGSTEALDMHHHCWDIFDVTYWITVCTRGRCTCECF